MAREQLQVDMREAVESGGKLPVNSAESQPGRLRISDVIASVLKNLKSVMKLLVWEGLNPLVLGLKRHRRYTFDPAYAGINLGCGMNNAGNWLGIDGGVYVLLQKAPPTIVRMSYPLMTMKKEYSRDEYVKRIRSMTVLHHELDYGIPFNDNTVPAVFSSHFLEHVGHREAQKLLGECFRVLKPGGIIRIVVPSLDTEVQRIRQALERYEAGEITDIQPFVTTNVVGYSNKYSNHRWMYNFTELRSALETAGFTQVVEQSYRKGRIPDVEKLDNRGGLLVEAIKP